MKILKNEKLVKILKILDDQTKKLYLKMLIMKKVIMKILMKEKLIEMILKNY